MLRLWTTLKNRFIQNEDGAGMVEYALLVALIGVLLIVVIGIMTTALQGVFQGVADTLA